MLKIREMRKEERPRERLWDRGASALKIDELLAILLRTGMAGKSAILIGEELLCKYGSLEGLSRADVKELAGFKGVGPSKAIQLKAAFELGIRLQKKSMGALRMETPEAVMQYLGAEMLALDYESLRVIAMNTRLHFLGMEELSRGTVNETIAHPRDALRVALNYKAYGLLLVHNHPSGDPSPSSTDLSFTNRMRDACQLMQVEFIDHVILGRATLNHKGYYSFKEAGYL
ncbi:MAG: DNA repair protein RadC [Verrucomicrobiota bacterium]